MGLLADYRKEEKKNKKSSLFFETEELFPDKKEDTVSIFDYSPSKEKSSLSLRQYRQTNEGRALAKEQEGSSFLEITSDVLQDIALQPIGGAVDAAESIANLVLPKEKEIEISDYIPEAKTTFGRFVRPASQFLIPYTGAYKILRGGYLFLKNSSKLKKTLETGKKVLDVKKN